MMEGTDCPSEVDVTSAGPSIVDALQEAANESDNSKVSDFLTSNMPPPKPIPTFAPVAPAPVTPGRQKTPVNVLPESPMTKSLPSIPVAGQMPPRPGQIPQRPGHIPQRPSQIPQRPQYPVPSFTGQPSDNSGGAAQIPMFNPAQMAPIQPTPQLFTPKPVPRNPFSLKGHHSQKRAQTPPAQAGSYPLSAQTPPGQAGSYPLSTQTPPPQAGSYPLSTQAPQAQPSSYQQIPTTQQIHHAPPPVASSYNVGSSVDIEYDSVQGPVYPTAEDKGLFGWMSGGSFMNRFKGTVESVITTLDPGMKEIINSGGDLDIIVASDKEVKVSAVREAFQTVFGRATVNGMASQYNLAPQPVGYKAGLKGAEERIESIRRSGNINALPIVAVENFIAELMTDEWFDIGCLLLKDDANDIKLMTFTQATPIAPEYIAQMKEETPADYNLSWSGFSVTLGDVIQRSNPNIPRTSWHEALTGVTRRDMILSAAKVLAGMYQRRLPQKST